MRVSELFCFLMAVLFALVIIAIPILGRYILTHGPDWLIEGTGFDAVVASCLLSVLFCFFCLLCFLALGCTLIEKRKKR